MSVTLTNVETKVRALIGDNSLATSDPFTYGNSPIFTLSESNVLSVTSVYVNDSPLGDSDWSYDSTEGKVTISSSLSSGDSIEINYTMYPNYSSTELQNYIEAGLVHISANNYKDFIVQSSTIFPEPDDREINLIAMIASIIVEPDNRTYRTPDVSVIVPKDLPTHKKIREAILIFKKNTHGIIDVI